MTAPHICEGGKIAFDEQHQRVAVVWPDYGDDGIEERDPQRDPDQILRRLLFKLCGDSVNAKTIGQRLLLLNWTLNRCESQKNMAKLLGLSKGRVSQIITALRAELNLRP